MSSLAREALLAAQKKRGESDQAHAKSTHPSKHAPPKASPSVSIRVCTDKSCKKADSQTLLAALQLAASALPAVSVKACKCRDKCERAPVVELSGGGGRELLTNVSAEQVEAILARLRPKAPPP